MATSNKLVKWVGTKIKELTVNGPGPSLAYGDYVDIVAPSIYRGGIFDGMYFFGGDGVDYRFQYSNLHSSVAAYNSCPPLAAVINRKAQCYINGQTRVMNTQGKEATGANAAKLRKLLRRPNPLQTWRQFEAQQYIYIQLFGFCITLPIIPAGFESGGPIEATSMWNLPPTMLRIQETNKLFYQTDITGIIKSIEITYKNQTTQLPIENLFIFRDFVPSANSIVFPESRIRAIAMPINNVIGAYMSRNELINYAGAQGIFSPEASDVTGTLPLKENEKEQLQDDFKRQYGIQRGQFRYIISPTKMNWVSIGRPTRDLMLFEEIVDDIMRICDSYNYPSQLLNSEKGPSVSNTSAYQAQIYSDGIMPESIDIYEQWNAFFKTDEYNLELIKDYSDVPVLQDNKEASGRALFYLNQSNEILWNMDMITANEIRDSNELDEIPDGDMYRSEWIAAGKVPGPSPSKSPLPNQQQNSTQQDGNENQNQ